MTKQSADLATKPIMLTADVKLLSSAIDEALLLAKSPQTPVGLRDRVFKFLRANIERGIDLSDQFCDIEAAPARRAGELRFVFKPSKRFLKLIAALRAAKRKTLIAWKPRIGHRLAP